MIRTALYPGSFDPITNGHIDVLRQSLNIADRIVVAIGISPKKPGLFNYDQRQKIISKVLEESFEPEVVKLVSITKFTGLVVHAAQENNANIIIRGLRDSSDLDYEMRMVGMNETMKPDLSTVFIPASIGVRHISATLVRQIAQMGGDVAPFVATEVVKQLKSAYS